MELPWANTQSGQVLMVRAVSQDRSASCPSLAQRGSHGGHRAPPREEWVPPQEQLDSWSLALVYFSRVFPGSQGFWPTSFPCQEGWRTCVLLGYGNLVRPLRCGYLHTRWKGRPCARVRFNSCKKRCRRRLTVRMLSCPRSRTRPRSTLSSSRKNTVMQCCRAAMKLRRSKCRSCNLDVCLFARADFD